MKNTERRRWWALGALALSVLVVGLDLTVLNLALPTLGTDLHASTSDLQWFVDAYSLVLAAALLPAGLLGDRYRPQEAADRGAGRCSAWRRWPARTRSRRASSWPPGPCSGWAPR